MTTPSRADLIKQIQSLNPDEKYYPGGPEAKKSVDKNTLAVLELQYYINDRAKKAEYIKTFSIFGKTFNFGYSQKQKLQAATAFYNHLLFKNPIPREDIEVLKNGDLGNIYKYWKK